MAKSPLGEQPTEETVDGKTNGKGPVVQVLDDVVNSDLTAERNEYLFRTPVLVDNLAPLLKDQRDLPMLCLLLNIVQVLVPGVATVFCVNLWMPHLSLMVRNAVGLGYLLTNILLFQERFTLCIHFASHRPVFYNDILNGLINYAFAPFFGIPPGLYKLHHVIMHHIENNHEGDASSTEKFQRDSVVHFLQYWYRFILRIWYDLLYFTVSTKRWSWLSNVSFCLAVWLNIIYLLATRVNFVATLWVFVIPHIFAMSVMAFGNWSQHIFVNPADRHSNYGLTYNCLDTPVNRTTFNDGYHIIHHLNARLHWSEIPQYFYDNREKHLKAGAITFRGVHFFDVGALVMTGQLRKLAEKYYVHLGSKETAPTVDEVEAKLRSWLKPCPRDAAQTKAKSS